MCSIQGFTFYNWLTVNIFSTNILFLKNTHVTMWWAKGTSNTEHLLCWWVNGNQKPMEIGSNDRWEPLPLIVPAASRVCWFLTSNCLAMWCGFEVDSISVLLCHEHGTLKSQYGFWMPMTGSWVLPTKTFCEAELAAELLRQWGNHIMFYFHVKHRCPLCMILYV